MKSWMKYLAVIVGVPVLIFTLAISAMSITVEQVGISGKQVYSYDQATGFARMQVVIDDILVLAGGEHIGATEDEGYVRVVGGIIRTYVLMNGVTTNTTSATLVIPSGGKTPIARVDGTGAITATVTYFGAMTSTAADGVQLCVITLNGTTRHVKGCDGAAQFSTDYPYYYTTTTNVTGTGATVQAEVTIGVASSGSSTGGDASAANQTTMITALQLIDNVVGVEDAAETAGGGLSMAGSVRRDVAATSAGSTAENATVNTDALGLLWTRKLDPCSGIAKTHIPINISTAATTELTAALSGASVFYYVCSIDLVTAAANNVALVDDNTDGCGSVTAGLAGGTTAATGWNLGANGGLTKGNGDSTVFKAVTSNAVLCLVTSAATQLSGSIQVVAAP